MNCVKVRVLLLTTVWVMWLIPTVLVAERVAADSVNYETGKSGPGINTSCPVAGHDSDYGSARWQWWPPGEVCLDPQGTRMFWPHAWRAGASVIAVIGFVVLPLLTVASARAERRRHEADSGAGDRLDELTWLSE
jgi:hypothetical protein